MSQPITWLQYGIKILSDTKLIYGFNIINALKFKIMYEQITNKKGEKLYILTSVSTNDVRPYVTVNTWEKCKETLEQITIEKDTSTFFAQLIHKEVNEEFHKAEASMRCNKIGWGSDYFKYITIEPLYTEAW